MSGVRPASSDEAYTSTQLPRLIITLLLCAAAAHSQTASAEATTVSLPPISQEALWQGAGVIVNDATAFPGTRAAMLAARQFRWVALKVDDGLKAPQANLDLLQQGWAAAFRSQGIYVCGWGVGQTQPGEEANVAADIVDRYKLDCYITDVEAPYLGGAYGGDPGRSQVFATAFREREPELPAAFTTLGAAAAPWVLPLDYKSWADENWDLLPEAYMSITSDYCPKCTVDHAERAGFPTDKVHPMIGIGWTQGQRRYGGDEYAELLEDAGTTGFSVFLGETTSDTDFAALGQAIADDGIAR